MIYRSTRNNNVEVTSAEAIAQGISVDGGLFIPDEIPAITLDEIKKLSTMKYNERAAYIFAKYLTDFTDEEIRYCTDNAYTDKKFSTENISEISHLFDGTYMLELWHGPTCAFKDMALQILPYLLTTSAKKINCDKKIVILVATSGDTGKAALEGFKDVPGTQIMVFYPEQGVSPMQKRQMTTQEGDNVAVCAIKGNFDDAQNGVKAIFTNDEIKKILDDNGMMFSSANSINWGRLAPQIIYYVSAYATLVADEEIALGDKINVVVPTGNFGNILAAYFAKKMGVPETIAEVENIEYIKLAEGMGVDAVINKKLSTAGRIFRFTLSNKVRSIKCLNGSDAEVLEFIVNPDSSITKGPIEDLHFPKEAIIGGIIRGNESFIANEHTIIKPYDRVVVFALPQVLSKVNNFFI